MKYFILIVKILIPITFFAVANIGNVLISNAIAGVMTIAVLAMVGFEWVNKAK